MNFRAFVPALAAVACLSATDAIAQTEEPDRRDVMLAYCDGNAGRRHADLRIGACTYFLNGNDANIGARVQRAGAYREVGDLPAALTDYQRALELDPNRATALVGIAIAYRMSGDFMGAAGALGQYRAVTTDQADYWAQLCRLQGVEGRDLAAAEQSCTRSLELRPGNWFAHLNRAMARLKQGRLDLARADFDAAQANGGESVVNLVLYGRGLIKTRQGQTAEGEADMARAVRLYPEALEFFATHGLPGQDYAPWRDLKTLIRTEIANAASGEWADWAARCNGEGEGLTVAKAIAGCTLILRSGGVPLASITNVLNRRARYYGLAGLHADALTDINHAIELAPDNPLYLYRRAEVRLAQGEYDLGMPDIDRAIAINGSEPAYFSTRARLYQAKGQYSRALADWDSVIGLTTENPVNYARRGSVLLELESYPRAIADYDRALELKPGDAGYLNQRCWARALAGRDLPLALADCEASLQARDDVNTLDSRAAVKLQMGDFEGAYADYDAVWTRDATLSGALYGRGIAQIRLGRVDAGRADIAAALAADSQAGKSFDRMGQRP